MTLLAIAGLVFLGIHIIPATRLRREAVALVGEGPYLGLFSLLSLISIWWWVVTFRSAPFDTPLWYYPEWWPWLEAILMLVAFILLVCGVSSPNPTLPRGGKLLERPDVGHGILAVTRHPLMWSFGIWAIAHFISQPNWRGFWFFGLFAITAIGGAVLQEWRKAETYGAGWERFAASTSFIPFAAILQGRARLNLAEIGWWRIAVGVVLWALVLYLHGPLLGVAPLPGLVR